MDNLQGLCKPCHSAKTAAEGRWGGPVQTSAPASILLVCGPPGSGKSKYVRDHMQWGDLVIDMDLMFMAVSGLPEYDKPASLLPYVRSARETVLGMLQARVGVSSAWIIMGGARAIDRKAMELRFLNRTETIMLLTSPIDCMKRISADKRRSGRADLWRPLVKKWWEDYSG